MHLRMYYILLQLRAVIRRFQKIRYVVSVRLSVLMEELGSRYMDFHEI
jgi:hypothetical protein